MAEDKPTKAEDDKVFDISKPGKTAASPSSRPLIITNKPILKDPMMTDKKSEANPSPEMVPEETEETKSAPAVPSSSRIKITPPSEAKAAAEESKADDKKDEKTEEPPKEDKPEEKEEDSESKKASEAVVNAVIDQATEKRKGEIKDDETKKRKEEVNGLIEERKYIVPIGQKKRKRNTIKLIVVLVLVIIGALVALNFLLDAEIINSSVKPLTNVL